METFSKEGETIPVFLLVCSDTRIVNIVRVMRLERLIKFVDRGLFVIY